MTCDSCKWKRNTECHRYPPQVLSSSPMGYWPRVLGTDLCGEYVPRETVQAQAPTVRRTRKKTD